MKKILLATVLSLVVSFSQAQFLQGLAASKVVHGADAVLISERTGHVQYIHFGDGAPQSLEQLLEKRKPWMPQYAGTVSFRDKMSFEDKLGFTHTRKQMLVNGLPIEGGIVITHVRGGKLESVNGDLYRIKCPNTPVLDEAQALQRALDHVPADQYRWENSGIKNRFSTQAMAALPHGELVYAPRKGEYRDDNFALAWKFDIFATKPLNRQWVFVDAQTGEVIYTINRIHTADVVGSAITMYSGTLAITADQTGPNSYRLHESGRGGGIITRNCQTGVDYNTAVDFTDTDNLWNNVNPALDQAAPDAHIGTEATYDYYNLRHNWHSYDNLNSPLLSFVHYDVQFGNAFWDGTEMTYGDGDGGTFSGPLTTFDVCGHEITHGVTEHTATLVYANEPGALNESFSDIFGKALEHQQTPGIFSWLVGKQCTVGAIGIRDMENPNVFANPGCVGDPYWNPGNDVHYNSGVQNHWFYILTMGDTATNALGNAYSVAALGFTKAEDIAFRNLSVYLTPNSQFTDARFYAIQSATDLYGACSSEMIQTANAWYAVGVGGPWTNTPLAAFAALPHTFCNAPSTVHFNNTSNSGASYLWDFGDGGTSTQANPSHIYNSLGTYTVKLVVTSCNGAKDSLILNNYIVLDTNIACTVTMPQTGNTLLNYCNGTVEDPGGQMDYPDNALSTVTITPPVADYLQLTFATFALEDFFDFLTIYDGPSTASPTIGSYTGQTLPNGGTITTSTGSVTLEFSSDQSVTMPGFLMSFECFTATSAPTALYNFLPTLSCNGLVTFTDASTDHPNTWSWDFGDGGTSTLPSPTHQYTTPGTYTVTLQVCNSVGCDTYTCTNCVTYDPNASICHAATLPLFGQLMVAGCGGVLQDDGGLGPYTDNVDSWAVIAPPGASQVTLDFTAFELEDLYDSVYVHDGASTAAPLMGGFSGFNLPNMGQPFVSSGGALTVHFKSDFSVTYQGFSANWWATGSSIGPQAQFTAPTTGNIGQVLNFTDQSTSATGWYWDFADGSNSGFQSPTHAFAANGVYPVTLRVTNDNGCDDFYTQNVYIGMVAATPATAMALDVWPNPAQDQVHLNLRLPSTTDIHIQVLDALGQLVYAEQASGIETLDRVLDVSHLSQGMYFVKVETPQGQLVRKLVLE